MQCHKCRLTMKEKGSAGPQGIAYVCPGCGFRATSGKEKGEKKGLMERNPSSAIRFEDFAEPVQEALPEKITQKAKAEKRPTREDDRPTTVQVKTPPSESSPKKAEGTVVPFPKAPKVSQPEPEEPLPVPAKPAEVHAPPKPIEPIEESASAAASRSRKKGKGQKGKSRKKSEPAPNLKKMKQEMQEIAKAVADLESAFSNELQTIQKRIDELVQAFANIEQD